MFLDEREQEQAGLDAVGEAEELTGKMGSDADEERLAHTVLEGDTQSASDARMLAQSADYAMGSFTPDLMFEQLVERYQSAQRLYGPTIIRALTGYDGEFIERNLRISEFKERLKENIHKSVERLRKEGLIDKEGDITPLGERLAALAMYAEELDHLRARGLGKRDAKERAHYGERDARERFAAHRYKDVDVRASVRLAIRRGHARVGPGDLVASRRVQHGRITVVYALDASGSMRGEKMHVGKRAGIALAHHAIEDGNDVGLVVFTSKVERSVAPTRAFPALLGELAQVRAGQETDLAVAVSHATGLFPKGEGTKHLILLTDAIPTRGEEPGRAAMDAVAMAKDAGITTSIVGINLEREGERLAKRMVELGAGKLYRVRGLEDLDVIVLEDYEMLKG